jgi:quercetin dioxygenase-like cupin family protein
VKRAALPALVLLAGCAGSISAQDTAPVAPASPPVHAPPVRTPPFGSNVVFREQTNAAPGHELIVADLNLPPDAVGDAHWHPWEEYIYVLGGSAVLDIEGLPARTLMPGEHFVIPRETVHTPRAGPEGVRAMTIRVHDAGDPVTVPAAERLPQPR